MKLLDIENAIPIMETVQKENTRAVMSYEERLQTYEIDWGSGPVTFVTAKPVPSITAVDAICQILRRYFIKHRSVLWNPSRVIGNVLVDVLHAQTFPENDFFAIVKMDHVVGSLESFTIRSVGPRHPNLADEIPNVSPDDQLPTGITWLGILGHRNIEQLNMGTLFVSVWMPKSDVCPWTKDER